MKLAGLLISALLLATVCFADVDPIIIDLDTPIPQPTLSTIKVTRLVLDLETKDAYLTYDVGTQAEGVFYSVATQSIEITDDEQFDTLVVNFRDSFEAIVENMVNPED